MDDLLIQNTKVKTKQVIEIGETVLIDHSGWMITDMIICNNSDGYATLIVKDDEDHRHIIASVRANETFSHSFNGGWRFWTNARLYLVKESVNGFINTSLGVIPTHTRDYSIWRME